MPIDRPKQFPRQARGRDATDVTKNVARHALRRFRRHALEVWESRGGGYYGFVAAVTFLGLEAVNLFGDVAGLPHLRLGLGGLIGWLVQNVVQGLMTALWAAIWPVAWISHLGVGLASGALLVGSYGVYRVIHPRVGRWLREGEEEGGRTGRGRL
jgi:hypothetical protein